jgi:hypothetical protein
MSRLTVGSLEGLSENSNVISVPTGHTLNAVDGLQIGGVAQGVRTSWIPTWSSLTIGNGTETAYYTVFNGLMFIDYRLVWGSTTSMSTNPAFVIPSGWQQAAAGFNVVGQVCMRDTGTDEFFGFVKGNGVGSTTCLLKTSKASATYGQTSAINGSIPFTWTTSDELMFTALFPVTAV